jgi:putative nucleotidyltransferase with HDIG domain
MADKQILVAHADLPTLGGYGRALGAEWKVTMVPGAAAATTRLATHSCDVVVADFDLPEVNGQELLDQIHREHPKIIRILLADEADAPQRLAAIQGSHLLLTKPCDSDTLKTAITRALAVNRWLANDSLRELVARLRTFPIVPSLYLEVVSALKNPDATTAEVGAIIARDMAMMTKLLQVTNSASFGMSRKISDPVEAVGILGFETVKSMVMTLKLLNQYDKVKPVYFSIDRLWRHSTEVARLARRLALTQSDDPVLAESAFTAGLMHDLGKVILASNFDDQYSGAQALARKQQIPLDEIESQIFGGSHGEIGAYLLGLWGMPLELVEAAALHHHPARSLAQHFSPLTAVHVANSLIYEVKHDKEGFVAPQIDCDWLAKLGVLESLPAWRDLAIDQDSGVTEIRARAGAAAICKKPSAPASKPAPRLAKSGAAPAPSAAVPAPSAPRRKLSFNQWLAVGLGTAAFAALFWLGAAALVRRAVEPAAVQPARIAQANIPPVNTIPNPAPAPAPPAADVVQPAAAVPAPAVTAAAPPPTAKDQAFAELQVQSIFYARGNSIAVINGQTVRAHDQLPDGAQVVEIGPSSVTVQFEDERKTLALK